jgi:hypothetical protein
LPLADVQNLLVSLLPLTTSYIRIALIQKLRHIIDEGVGYGLALREHEDVWGFHAASA